MATGRVFTANVVLAKSSGGEPIQFKIGDEVPVWATKRVGDHVSQGVTRSSEAPEPITLTSDAGDGAEVVTDAESDDLDSYLNWTKAELKDEAKGREITGYSAMSKEELAAALEADDAAEEAE